MRLAAFRAVALVSAMQCGAILHAQAVTAGAGKSGTSAKASPDYHQPTPSDIIVTASVPRDRSDFLAVHRLYNTANDFMKIILAIR